MADPEARTYDLLVVGGGIHGAWVARDAALRGLSVCLVEMEDWGWATSAKSSKLAHGGLRYLELLEFGLVHEALQERERLLRHAPHLVHPLRFLYPVYPHVASRRTVKAGLLLYDVLSHGKSLPNRKSLSAAEALRLVPGLQPEGLAGGATFSDAQVQSVERLVAELVWDAREHGATTVNHTKVVGLLAEPAPSGGHNVVGAHLQGPTGRTSVKASLTVNATGAWVDAVLAPLGPHRPLIRTTKGAHLVVPRFCDTALIVKAASDKRTFFIMPWGRHCVVGTTDTDWQGDPAHVVATPEDVSYLQTEARRYFPDAPLDQVQYTYAGVRALVNQQGLPEGRVTRRHIVVDHTKDPRPTAGLLTMQGGKITTARSTAEAVVDLACRRLGRKGLAKRHPTRTASLPGGPLTPWPAFRDEAVKAAMATGLPEASALHLVGTYGARWRRVVECDARPEARLPVVQGRPHIRAEVTWAVREEQATTLSDVLLRRLDLGLHRDGNPRAAAAVAAWMGDLLGWSAAECSRQLALHAKASDVLAVPSLPRPLAGSSLVSGTPTEPL